MNRSYVPKCKNLCQGSHTVRAKERRTYLSNTRLRNSICAHVDARITVLEHHVVRQVEVSIVRDTFHYNVVACKASTY